MKRVFFLNQKSQQILLFWTFEISRWSNGKISLSLFFANGNEPSSWTKKVSKCYCFFERFRPVDDQWGRIFCNFFCKWKLVFFLNQKSPQIVLLFWMFQSSRYLIGKIISQLFWKWKNLEPKKKQLNVITYLNDSDRHINNFYAAQRSQIRFFMAAQRSQMRF